MMNDLAADIRDGRIRNLTIVYDWEKMSHTVRMIIGRTGMAEKEYFFRDVEEFHISEDFRAADISHCKFLDRERSKYLSLDPYLENLTPDDRDNFIIIAASVEVREILSGQQIDDGNAVKPPGDERKP